MTKRFCDTELWHKDWFLKLSVELRMLYMYLKDNCDCAGIYELNTMLASFILGHDVTIDDFLKLNEHKKIIEVIDDNHLYLCDFVLFQQGIESLDELNPRNNAHKGIMRRLKKYGIISVDDKVLERTPRKDKKETENTKNESVVSIKKAQKNKKSNPLVNETKSLFISEFEKVFGKKPYLSYNDSLKIVELESEHPDIKEIIPVAVAKLKDIYFNDIEFKPSASWLLNGNNFERVLNGEFDNMKKKKTLEELAAEIREREEKEKENRRIG